MQDIFFRAKAKQNNEWVYGDYLTSETRTGGKNHYIKRAEDGILNPITIIPETVGQYTGLTDQNGKLIFDGDIILYGLIPCVVKYEVENARYMLYEKGEYLKNGFNIDTMKLKEVIGNVHDNPEMLGGK